MDQKTAGLSPATSPFSAKAQTLGYHSVFAIIHSLKAHVLMRRNETLKQQYSGIYTPINQGGRSDGTFGSYYSLSSPHLRAVQARSTNMVARRACVGCANEIRDYYFRRRNRSSRHTVGARYNVTNAFPHRFQVFRCALLYRSGCSPGRYTEQ